MATPCTCDLRMSDFTVTMFDPFCPAAFLHLVWHGSNDLAITDRERP